MRKFKLIKTYPGSPKLDTIVEVKHDGYIHWNVNSNENNPTNYIHNSAMEQYKEFWEEVVEKNEYQILELSLQRSIKPEIINVSDSGKEYILSLLNCQGNSIHSIKRLSDGEIFTIGDKTHLTNGNYYNFELKEFRFFNNGSSGHLEKYRNKTFLKAGIVSDLHKEPTFFYLEDIVKTELPLFKTEDGIDICKGDLYHYVVTSNFDLPNKWKVLNHIVDWDNPEKPPLGAVQFSDKSKAEEYILMNKPCLSINDVRNCINQTEIDIDNEHELNYQLIELVKEKLNGNK